MNDRVRGAFGVVGFGIGAFALIATTAVYVLSERELARRYSVPVQEKSFGIEVDAELVDRGRHLVTVVAQCGYCHGPDLAGREMADDPWIGRLYASNLTRGEGGVGGWLSDSQWDAAVRHGIDPEGRSLLLMPSAQLAHLSDRDLAVIVAYVRQTPAVDRVMPGKQAGWLTRWVVALGLASDLISAQQVLESPRTGPAIATAEATSEYGEYLVALGAAASVTGPISPADCIRSRSRESPFHRI